jgi:RecB family exonuclease
MLMTCTPAVLNPDGLQVVESENETATLGTLVHGLCEELVKTGAVDLEAVKNRVTPEEYERAASLFNNFLTVWRQASRYIPNPITEQAFSAGVATWTLTGHIDCYSFNVAEGRAFVLDYKTGRTHEDHYHQMAAYAYLVWDAKALVEPFTAHVSAVYLEDNSVHPYTFTADDLKKWANEVTAKLDDLRYTTGRKCALCTLQDTCPAYRVYARNALAVLSGIGGNETPGWWGMSPNDRGKLVDQMYAVDKALDRARLSLRNEVKAKGSVDIGGGKEYALVESEDRVIDVEKAIPILAKRIGAATVHRNSRLPLDSVLTAYAAKAAKGQKGRARKELLEELEAAGAVQKIKSTRMWRRPKGEKTLEE